MYKVVISPSANADLFIRSLCFIGIYIGFTLISARYGDLLLASSAIIMKLMLFFSYFTDGFAYDLENPLAATKLADGIEACYDALAEFPAAHELCRDQVLARMGYRRYPVGNYLVIFRIVEETQEVRVVHIFHATQDYLSALRNER